MSTQNTEVKNVLDSFYDTIKGFSFASGEASEIHSIMLQSMKNLVQATDQFYEKKNDAYPKMTESSFDHLTFLYKDVLDVSGEYKKVMSGLTGVDQEIGNTMSQILESMETLLGKDLQMLSSAKEKGLTTLPEIVERARTKIVDVSDQNLEITGANMSQRFKVSVPGKNGNDKITGYFTEAFSSEYEKEFQGLLNRAIEKNPNIDKIYKIMQEEDSMGESCFDALLSRIDSTMIHGIEGEVSPKTFKSPETYISPDHALDRYLPISEKERDALLSGTGSVQDFLAFAKEVQTLKTKYEVLEQAGIEKNENIACRNSAMSTIADLFGMGDLIARSEPMTLIDKDKIYKGTFMEPAKGTDMMRCRPGDLLLKPDVTLDFENTTVKKQVTDLQILDYICGNVDRHGGNMFYQIEPTKDPKQLRLVGIQGIDNDCSFGTIEDGKLCLQTLPYLGAVSESTANTVCCLDENLLKAVLRNYNFSKQELDAVWKRTEKLQGAIREGYEFYKKNPDAKPQINHLRIVKDEEWPAISAEELDETLYSSCFSPLKIVVNNAKTEFFDKDYQQSIVDLRNSLAEYDKQGSGIRRLSDQLKKEDRGLLTGSRQYDHVMKLTKQLEGFHKASMTQKSSQGIHKLLEEYDKTITAAKAYLDYKMAAFEEKVRGKNETEKQKELEKFQNPKSRNFKRMAAVSELVSELEKYKKQGEKLLKSRENYEHSKEMMEAGKQKKYLEQLENNVKKEKVGAKNSKRVLMSREELFNKHDTSVAKTSVQRQKSKEQKLPQRQMTQPALKK